MPFASEHLPTHEDFQRLFKLLYETQDDFSIQTIGKVNIGLLPRGFHDSRRALDTFFEQGTPLIITELLPDELSFPVTEAAFHYFVNHFFFLPPRDTLPRATATQIETAKKLPTKPFLFLYDSSEKHLKATLPFYRNYKGRITQERVLLRDFLTTLQDNPQCRVLDLSQEPLLPEHLAGVQLCRYEFLENVAALLHTLSLADQQNIPCLPWRDDTHLLLTNYSPFHLALQGIAINRHFPKSKSFVLREVFQSGDSPENGGPDMTRFELSHPPLIAIDQKTRAESALTFLQQQIRADGTTPPWPEDSPDAFIDTIYRAVPPTLQWFTNDHLLDWNVAAFPENLYLSHPAKLRFVANLHQAEETISSHEPFAPLLTHLKKATYPDLVHFSATRKVPLAQRLASTYLQASDHDWIETQIALADQALDREPELKDPKSQIAKHLLFSELPADPTRRHQRLATCETLYETDITHERISPTLLANKAMLHFHTHGATPEFARQCEELSEQIDITIPLCMDAAKECALAHNLKDAVYCARLDYEAKRFNQLNDYLLFLNYLARYDAFDEIESVLEQVNQRYDSDHVAICYGMLVSALAQRAWLARMMSTVTFDETSVTQGILYEQKAKELELDTPDFTYKSSLFALESDRPEIALAIAQEATEPTSTVPYKIAGYAWYTGRHELASEILKLQSEDAFKLPYDRMRYALFNLFLGNLDEACSSYEHFLRHHPFHFCNANLDSQLWLLQSLAFQTVGLPDKAQTFLEMFRKKEPLSDKAEQLFEQVTPINNDACRALLESIEPVW